MEHATAPLEVTPVNLLDRLSPGEVHVLVELTTAPLEPELEIAWFTSTRGGWGLTSPT